jgi:hypothetical protein
MKDRISNLRTRIQATVDLMPDEMTADQIDSLLCPMMDTLDDVETGLARGMNETEAEMKLNRVQRGIDDLGVL